MPLDLELIRAREFIRVTAEGHLDLQTSKEALTKLARACHKRGVTRAMLDLRPFRVGPRPVLTPLDLAGLVDAFGEIGFTKEQRLAVLYTLDPHHRARLFSFICMMHGWQVRGFSSFENAMLWLSRDETAPSRDARERSVPVRTISQVRRKANHTMNSALLAILIAGAALVPAIAAENGAAPPVYTAPAAAAPQAAPA